MLKEICLGFRSKPSTRVRERSDGGQEGMIHQVEVEVGAPFGASKKSHRRASYLLFSPHPPFVFFYLLFSLKPVSRFEGDRVGLWWVGCPIV